MCLRIYSYVYNSALYLNAYVVYRLEPNVLVAITLENYMLVFFARIIPASLGAEKHNFSIIGYFWE